MATECPGPVTRAIDATVWDADTLPPGSAARVARARGKLPWTVVDGQLVPIRASVTGRVTRDGLPVAGAQITDIYREGPRTSTRMRWSATNSAPRVLSALAGLGGGYEVERIPAGEYTVTARSRELGCSSTPVTRTMSELAQSVDLELTECPAPP